jgi:hypothetical protein
MSSFAQPPTHRDGTLNIVMARSSPELKPGQARDRVLLSRTPASRRRMEFTRLLEPVFNHKSGA